MRIFAGVFSIQASILGFFSWLKLSSTTPINLFGLPEGLSANAGLILSILMFLAGILIILAKTNDFLLFLALVLWVFGLILGLFSQAFRDCISADHMHPLLNYWSIHFHGL
ncbi:hypothetical protein AAHO55_03340 [Listeria aquatica]